MITKEQLSIISQLILSELEDNFTLHPKKKIVPVYYNKSYYLIEEDTIIRLAAEGSYTRIIMDDKSLLSSKSISFYEKKLSRKLFFRCHNSHLINLSRILKISKGINRCIKVANNDFVPISLSRSKMLDEILGLKS